MKITRTWALWLAGAAWAAGTASGCGVLIPDTDASGEWTAVAVIVAVALVGAIGFAAWRNLKDDDE